MKYIPVETPDTITKWADETFGPAKSITRLMLRGLGEHQELLQALEEDDRSKGAIVEAADTTICYSRVGKWLGIDLQDAGREVARRNYGNVSNYYLASKSMTHAMIAHNYLCADHLHPSARIELYTVTTILEMLVAKLGYHLWKAVDRKMEVNRARKWEVVGETGCGFHRKHKEA